MSSVQTNKTSLQVATETSLATLPGSPVWNTLEPNKITKWGNTIKTVAREPISNLRQLRKGTVVDLDSVVEYNHDLTMELMHLTAEQMCFSQFKNTAPFTPTAVTATDYTVASGGALTAGWLIFARNFSTAGNNGLKVVGSSSTGTAIKASGLTAESPAPATARVEVCGVRGASGDIQIDSSGNIVSTVLDFTTLPLIVGQVIWVGGSAVGNQFATAGSGFARIKAIASHKLTVDKQGYTIGTDTGSGKTIDLLFGRFVRNVASTDADYLERSTTYEESFPDLGGVGTPNYEYANGNYLNSFAFNLPLTDKATVDLAFIGTSTDNPTSTRKTNANSGLTSARSASFNSASNVGRLRVTQVDFTGLTSDFKDVKLTISNKVSPEKLIGTLGASNMNFGNFEVMLDATALFSNANVVSAIRSNTTVTMDFALKNVDDGGFYIDIPSLTLGDGTKDLPMNETVKIKLSGHAFVDPVLNTSLSLSLFPYLP